MISKLLGQVFVALVAVSFLHGCATGAKSDQRPPVQTKPSATPAVTPPVSMPEAESIPKPLPEPQTRPPVTAPPPVTTTVPRLSPADPLARARQEQDYKRAFIAEASVEDHALASYGYYKSRKIAREGNTTLYVAAKTERDRLLEFVMVHDGSDGQEMLETLPPDSSRAIRAAPSFYAMLTRLLAGTPILQQRIYHHYEDYHHPKDDRLKVLGPHYTETPILITQFLPEWDGGRMTIVEHDRYDELGYDTETQRPLVTLDAAVSRLGPSTPVTSNVTDDPVVELGPEGPSDEYLDEQRSRRDALLSRGLIYRNDAFWSAFASGDIRSIFEGDRYGSTGYLGNVALMYYLSLNSERCAASIEDPGQFRLQEITTRTDGWGNQSTSATDIWNMTVPGRFQPHLHAIYDPAKDKPSAGETIQYAMQMMQTPLGMQIRDLKEQTVTVSNIQKDVRWIVDEGGCSAPMKQQLEEMLYHYAAVQDPAQFSQLRFPNATEFSDEVYRRGSAPDIKTACLAASDFTPRQGSRDYCACTQRVMERNAPERLDTYASRYRQLRADYHAAKLAVQRGLDHPDIRVFGNLDSSCVKM